MSDENQKPAGEATPKKGELKVKVRNKTASGKAENAKRRWLLVAGGAVAVVLLATTLLFDKPERRGGDIKPPAVNTTPPGLEERGWQAQSQTEIKLLREALESVNAQNRNLTKQITGVGEVVEDLREKLRAQAQADAEARKALKEEMAKLPPPPGDAPGTAAPTEPSAGGDINRIPPPPPLPRGARPSGKRVVSNTIEEQPIVLTVPDDVLESDEVEVEVTYRKNKFAGALPMGSSARVVMLHGLDAGSSDYTRTNPEPILLRVQNNATMPGGGKYQVKSCHVLASAHGDLSSERVYARLSSLSCVDKRNHLVLSADLKGYLIGPDGQKGMKGTVERRDGSLIAMSVLGGFVDGMSEAFGSAMDAQLGDAVDSENGQINFSPVLGGAGFAGAQQSASSLSDYYLEQAKNIFPVIVVPAGTAGTIVVTEPVSLEWKDHGAIYTKEVRPVKQ